MTNLSNFLFYRGRNNKALGQDVLVLVNELLGKPFGISPEFKLIDFGSWRDGCPNDRIIDFNNIEGKNIIFFDSLISKTAMLDFLSLVYAFKHQYKAARVIAVNPFILVRRNDHEEKLEEIQYLKQYLHFLSVAGADELITCTPHSDYMGIEAQKFGIKFRPAYMDFSRTLKTIIPKNENIFVYSPDKGSIPRAIAHAKKIPGSVVVFDLKVRKKNNQTEIVNADEENIEAIKQTFSQEFGLDIKMIKHISEVDVTGANVIIIDDELASGGTANSTAKKLKGLGAKSVYFAFTHPVCVNGWKLTTFFENPFEKVLAGDTIIRDDTNRTGGKIVDCSTSEVIAAAIYEAIIESLNR
ncbi:MAG TPA: phosphoribosyltransferase family protein [bacterium]|nr:phosphoribosyltransferase family protein [bacterium]